MKPIRRKHQPITDIFLENKKWGRGDVIVRCDCGKEWPEGDRLESHGGKACKMCCKKTL